MRGQRREEMAEQEGVAVQEEDVVDQSRVQEEMLRMVREEGVVEVVEGQEGQEGMDMCL